MIGILLFQNQKNIFKKTLEQIEDYEKKDLDKCPFIDLK